MKFYNKIVVMNQDIRVKEGAEKYFLRFHLREKEVPSSPVPTTEDELFVLVDLP